MTHDGLCILLSCADSERFVRGHGESPNLITIFCVCLFLVDEGRKDPITTIRHTCDPKHVLSSTYHMQALCQIYMMPSINKCKRSEEPYIQ